MLSDNLEYLYSTEKSDSQKSSTGSDLRNSTHELRRSPRFRKNVKFYGNVTTHPVRSRRKKINSNIKMGLKNPRNVSIISLGTNKNFKHNKHYKSEGIISKNTIQLLKQKGFVLPAIRCINRITGEHQIGIPKFTNKVKKNNPPTKISLAALRSDMNAHFSTLHRWTQQEDAILENLVSLVPYECMPSNYTSIKEFCTKLLNDFRKSKQPELKNEINNEDSKYHWL